MVDLQTISNLRKLKGIHLLFTEHVSILTLGNFFFDFKNPTIMMSSVYKYSNSQEHL